MGFQILCRRAPVATVTYRPVEVTIRAEGNIAAVVQRRSMIYFENDFFAGRIGAVRVIARYLIAGQYRRIIRWRIADEEIAVVRVIGMKGHTEHPLTKGFGAEVVADVQERR